MDANETENSSLINQEISVELGASAFFDCFVKSNPFPHIKWYKNGEKIEYKKNNQKGKLKVTEKRMKLEIKNVDEDDSGTYTCIAKNIVGKTKKNINLNVFSEYFLIKRPRIN